MQEHGDLINVHEWFHSFMAVISNPPLKAKKKLRMSPSPKKRKDSKEARTKTDASIQYPLPLILITTFSAKLLINTLFDISSP